MIFIRYENLKSYLRYYPVTSLILLINIIMFILVAFSGDDLLRFGALTNDSSYEHERWRYLSAIFLHDGFDHLLFNSFALMVFAPPMERLLGSWKYAVLYLGAGLLANALSMAYYNYQMELTLTVGASGAIYGVYGGFLYVALLQRQMIDEASRKTLYAILMVGLVFSIMVDNINWMAHLGGLITGFFIYGILIRISRVRRT
ncbi:rhomboid family intramembrane serine protease [Paenibacillus sp. YPG26]|uniref:rhomboid family intramembrane serine protease n=1 Tax=Paenibacillus sp. YPG26 TaxID=2878915 RepID=UPI00203B825E|nr:rhomboid family intramembrane serine protease [Paenibacillus sp. YPG26]USB35101.1 rhomboid family intramembrane serine protease [Paenibacillus sp. YPG26]